MFKPKNQHGFALVESLLILLMIGIIGGTGWYVWHSKQSADKSLANADSSSNTSTKVAKKSSQPTVGQITNWKTLTSPDGWTIKIPSNWFSQTCDADGGSSYVGVASNKEGLGICNSDAVAEMGFSVSNNLDELKYPPTKSSDDKSFVDERVTINGAEGHKYTTVKKTDASVVYSGFVYVDYSLSYNGKLYGANYIQNENGPDDQSVFDQIVKTWKF